MLSSEEPLEYIASDVVRILPSFVQAVSRSSTMVAVNDNALLVAGKTKQEISIWTELPEIP